MMPASIAIPVPAGPPRNLKFGPADSIAPLAAPNSAARVADLLP